ncbi:MAG: hypothetical protein HYZ20_04110 [Burkholderiales bacterium]|nr:hypothetical protein [Burkholderiales bacterium]
MAGLPTWSIGQSASASFAIRYSPLARTGALGFIAQDLAAARDDMTDPQRDLQTYVARALDQFHRKNGRHPQGDLELAVAVVDWVATVMRHPAFYPEDPGLPRLYPQAPSTRYDTFVGEAVRILNYTLAFDPADTANWPSPLCTQQNFAAAGMLNVLGLHARLVEVEGHTGLEYYSFAHYKWIWADATYNEHYESARGEPLGVLELNRLTLHGGIEKVRAIKHGYPTADFRSNTFLQSSPHGFRQYAAMLYMNNFAGNGRHLNKFHTVVYSPEPPAGYRPLPGEILNFDRLVDSGGWFQWPKTDNPESLDTPIGRLAVFDGLIPGVVGVSFRLRCYLPYTQRFEARMDDGPWTAVENLALAENGPILSAPIVAPWNGGRVAVRAVDNVGNATLPILIDMKP